MAGAQRPKTNSCFWALTQIVDSIAPWGLPSSLVRLPSSAPSVTLDCIDQHRLGKFWSEALALDLSSEGDYVLLRSKERRSGLQGFTLQRVPEAKVVKNRMHLDVVVSDVPVEVKRFEGLGAKVLTRESDPTQYETVVVADPEGNEFCVIKARDHHD